MKAHWKACIRYVVIFVIFVFLVAGISIFKAWVDDSMKINNDKNDVLHFYIGDSC